MAAVMLSLLERGCIWCCIPNSCSQQKAPTCQQELHIRKAACERGGARQRWVITAHRGPGVVIPAQGLLYVAFGLLVPFHGFIPVCQEALGWLLFLQFGCKLLFYYHYFSMV